MLRSLVGSEMCIRDRYQRRVRGCGHWVMGDKYKIVVLGTGGVGKSSLTLRLCSGKFPKKHDPTIEDSFRTQIEVDDRTRTLDILDTAGQAEFRGLHEDYMREGGGFVIVYSIDDPAAFDSVDEFKDQVAKVCAQGGCKVPIVLVANKCDLTHERSVTLKEGREKADVWDDEREGSCLGEVEFFEASAKDEINVATVFETLVRSMDREAARQAPKPAGDDGRPDSGGTKPAPAGPAPPEKETKDKGSGCKCSIL
eukprot:TRINITY_DN3326_c0_g2_i3.p1 TRINITY_DN3326_c0_g2~~TRINITY_DN3326_c0_g2_i3.p1  ORF type:complete len:254 (+),score=66.01 TRINITY_DN3326_c0_g2_i3:124-885(+)